MDDAQYIDIVMWMYNLIKYIDNYVKTPGSLFQYYREKPALNNDGAIVDFSSNSTTDSFKFKENITSQWEDDGTKNVEIMVPLKYFRNFWRSLEMTLLNCEITLDLTWYTNWVI